MECIRNRTDESGKYAAKDSKASSEDVQDEFEYSARENDEEEFDGSF